MALWKPPPGMLLRCGLTFDPADQPKKRSTLRDALEADSLIYAMPILLGFLAQAFLPLKQISAIAPDTLKTYVADGKSIGALVFAIAMIIIWPIATVRRHRKQYGYHPKGTYQPGKINIWVAELEGDSAKHEARRRMVASLAELFKGSVAILLADTAPRLVDTGIAGQEADAGNLLAQEFLEANQGDLILWGQFFMEPTPLIELRLVSVAQDGRQATPFEYDTTTYRPVDKKFRLYFTAALAALVATMTQRIEEGEGSYIADVLRPLAEKIQPLIDSLPKDMAYQERARIFYGMGRLYSILGEQDDSVAKLRLSVRLLLRARRCWIQVGGEPQQATKTMQTLGRTYWRLGRKFKGIRFLEMSLKATDMVLSVFTPEADFVMWARCKDDQSAALYYIGQHTDSYDALEKGVVAVDAVLQRPELKDFPRIYSRTLESLACLYSELARLEASTHRLKLSLEVLRELVVIWTKDANPLDWARGQMNISITLARLWDLDNRKEMLHEAWAAGELALEVFSSDCHPAWYGTTKAIMGSILYVQHQWKEAADLYLEALTVLSPETDEYEYLKTKENLDNAYAQMHGGDLVVVVGQLQGNGQGGAPKQ
jgi:tetratricopeptide (TPR) repeat protein